jgi:integrase
MRAVFKHAVRLGYIKEADIPRFDLEAQQRNKRPSFTDAEVARLLAAAEERIAKASLPQVTRNKKLAAADWTDRTAFESRTVYERAVLYGFIDVALETGMRPTELFNLNWNHVPRFQEEREKPIEDRRIRILAYGKGRNPQELVPNVGAIGGFGVLWDAFVAFHGREPKPTDPIFVNATGERAQSFKKSLNALLEATDLKEDAFGRARSAYSFRHTYATRQLRKGTDVYTLAINMRTSVKMIEMYYSDVVPNDRAKQLEGGHD